MTSYCLIHSIIILTPGKYLSVIDSRFISIEHLAYIIKLTIVYILEGDQKVLSLTEK